MIDPSGGEWLTLEQVCTRLPHLKAATIRKWASRGVVGTYRIGADRWYFMPDVLDREAAARATGFRPGRRPAATAH